MNTEQTSSRKMKIQAKHLSKKFQLLSSKSSKNKFKSMLGAGKKDEKDFWALRNVSFEIRDGECVGVIGLNGAGKSTLSNIISGQIAQTAGSIDINGDVSIIAASAGMKNNLSGRENIRLKCIMLGLSNKEIEAKMDDIITFSELGAFIDQPVKTYSFGMKAKLGFSIMVHQEQDIMIIDEALSVGDKTFVDKSRKKMFEFRDMGKTILLVSHDMRTIKEWCDRVIWLNYGEVKAYGTPEEILPEYEEFVSWFKKLPKEEQEAYKLAQIKQQQSYSMDELKEDILDETDITTRQAKIEVETSLKNNKDNHTLSIGSKLLLSVFMFVWVWIMCVSLAGTTLEASVIHSKDFILEKVFQQKPEKPKDEPKKESNKKKADSKKKKSTSKSSKKESSKSANDDQMVGDETYVDPNLALDGQETESIPDVPAQPSAPVQQVTPQYQPQAQEPIQPEAPAQPQAEPEAPVEEQPQENASSMRSDVSDEPEGVNG